MPTLRKTVKANATKLLIILIFLVFLSASHAESSKIPLATDLSKTAEMADKMQIPVLLMVSQYRCEFCQSMKREVLDPMLLSGDYKEQVIIREILIDQGEMLTNFEGEREPAADFADRYGVFVTPTLLFLDADGKEAAERILGINTLDFLPIYIDEAIDSATSSPVR